MKTIKQSLFIAIMVFIGISCKNISDKTDDDSFKFNIDKFADIKIMRYQVPGFEKLPLNQKKLIYYLSEAALCGRDIIWDQNYKHNLFIRRILEEIVKKYSRYFKGGYIGVGGGPDLMTGR